MSLRTLLWIGFLVGMASASIIVMWQASKDPKNKKGPYYYANIVHRWVWLWVILLMLALLLWVADVISGYWVWMVFTALVAFVLWAWVLGLFRPLLVGLIVWGQQKVDEI